MVSVGTVLSLNPRLCSRHCGSVQFARKRGSDFDTLDAFKKNKPQLESATQP